MANCHTILRILVLGLVVGLAAAAAPAQDNDFDGPDPLADWQTTGAVSTDDAHRRGDAGAALKVGPEARATWPVRADDGYGTVDLWVYEDGAQHADPSQYGAGPQVGVVTTTGKVLVAGPVYASYLSGNSTYAISEYVPPGERPWYDTVYSGIQRTVGWHRWTFSFDETLGVTVLHNGEKVTRFSDANADVRGFSGVTVVGDLGWSDNPQTVWIDDVTVTQGEAWDPLEGIVPPEDPVVEGPAPEIVPELAGEHPRLLFSEADIATLRTFKDTPRGQQFWTRLEAYVPRPLNEGESFGTAFLTDATDGQRWGFWKLPNAGLHYLLGDDPDSLLFCKQYMQFLLDLDHWETTSEIDSGMSAANIMVGAALVYDWLYDELDPAFREQFRQKLWLQARRMYYAGHLMGADATHYWQGDPQNNHRWHRNAGFALCTLAAWTGADDQKWLMQQLMDEMTFVADWLPDDGTSHESPGYLIFGGAHLTVGMQAADRCLGADFLQRPFFETVDRFMIQTLAPGLDHRFGFGDQGGVAVGELGYDLFQLKHAGVHELTDAKAVLDTLIDRENVQIVDAWMALLWYPQGLATGQIGNIARRDFFADLGVQFVRDTWTAGGAGAMFKCGPFGGYTLNRFRMENDYQYINVAHDDPDANSFILFRDGAFVAETDRYSTQKNSANYNTILVDGQGQRVAGRSDTMGWWQPAAYGHDMSEIAVVTARATSGANTALEGEASRSYLDASNNPSLDRYRRTFIWVEGKYVLVLDDIRAPGPVDIDWLMQGPQLATVDAAAGRYRLESGSRQCPFQVDADATLDADVVAAPADNHGTPLGWQQLRLSANTAAARIVSVYDLWNRGGLTVELATSDADHATVNVTGTDLNDTWTWQAGQGRFGPSKILGRDRVGATILAVTEPEPQTRDLVSSITGESLPILGAWQSLATHDTVDLAVPLLDGTIESRADGLAKLEVAFSADLDPATLTDGAVALVGQAGGDRSDLIESVTLVGGNRLVVALSGPPPSGDWYTITLADTVRGADGSEIVGDRDVRIGRLVGDVDGSGRVTEDDMLMVRELAGNVTGSGSFRADVDGSGRVTGEDLVAVRRHLGDALP